MANESRRVREPPTTKLMRGGNIYSISYAQRAFWIGGGEHRLWGHCRTVSPWWSRCNCTPASGCPTRTRRCRRSRRHRYRPNEPRYQLLSQPARTHSDPHRESPTSSPETTRRRSRRSPRHVRPRSDRKVEHWQPEPLTRRIHNRLIISVWTSE